MKFKAIITGMLLTAAFSVSHLFASEKHDNLKIGVVDFRACLEKSYVGQEEQLRIEAMRNEMVGSLETKEKALTEVMGKLKNPEYLDTISPQMEEQLQREYAQLSEEMQQLQNQAYQALNQAQMKMYQSVSEQVSKCAEYLAREHNLDMIVNQEGTFYFKRPLDMTPLVIQELNRHFQPETAQTAALDHKEQN